MFNVIDLPALWRKEAKSYRRRSQENLARFLESLAADLEAEMLSEGHEALTSPGSAGGEPHADYTVAQVAEIFNRKPQTVRDWIKGGRLRAYRFNGREYRVTRAAVEEYMEDQRNGLPAQKGTADLSAWRHESLSTADHQSPFRSSVSG